MKFRYCFYGLLILICAFIPFRPSSTEITLINITPCVRWGSWTVGQSSGYGNSIDDSFITNSEQTCCVSVAVEYCERQDDWAYPITSFKFDITMNNGFEVKKYVYGTSGPDAALLSSDTSFSVKAKLEGPLDVPASGKAKDALPCSLNGRSNIPMEVTVKFTGYYGTDPDTQEEVTLEKTWEQDDVDMCRQEYVDMTPPKNSGKAELPVPDKGAFVPTISTDNGVDQWNTGHYKEGYKVKKVEQDDGSIINVPLPGFMIDDGLKDKKAAWLAAVNKYRTANDLSAFTDTDFQVNSGYRNPYHQRFHAVKGKLSSFHSRHCYGDALDIHTLDVDGDGTTEQVVGNEAKSDDGVLMQRRAEAKGVEALWTASWEYYGTHTHADWTLRRKDHGDWPPLPGTVFSPPCEVDGTASEGPCVTCVPSSGGSEDEPDDGDAGGDQETPVSITPTTITYACGIHSGDPSNESSDHQTTISGYSETFYECQPHQTFGCGHIDLNSNASLHALQASCLVTNANGDYCMVTGFYNCLSPHTHQYPAPTISCGRSACTETVSSTNEHRVNCANGHPYWNCNPSAVRHHITRTCRFSGCGRTWEKCTTPITPVCNNPWRKRNGLKCWGINE